MMEHLSLELRQKVIKMSEARLRQKLVQAGYREVDVAKLDRATLLEYYAKVLLTETAYVPAKEELSSTIWTLITFDVEAIYYLKWI